MRNKLAYSYSAKIHASGFNKLLESIFCLLVVVEVFSLKIVVQMLEEVVVGWRMVTWIRWMRQNFVAQFVQLLKCWLCDLWLGVVVKNWALSVDQCQLQALHFSVHLIGLPSILSDVMVLPGFRKLWWLGWAAGHQWQWPFFGANLVLWSFFSVQPLSWSSLVVI